MSLNTTIEGGSGSGYTAKVTKQGALVTSRLEFSQVKFNALATINTAYLMASPIANKQGIITEIIMSAGKDVGVNGALVDIYLGESPTTTTIYESVLTVQIPANSQMVLTGLNWLYKEGYWLLAKTDDNTIYLTMAGYYTNI